MGIDIFIDDNNHLGKHHLAHSPDAMHHLFGLSRVPLANGDNGTVVEHTLQGQI